MSTENLTPAEELLKNWNGGILRNAKTKLAQKLQMHKDNVSKWLHGRQEPSERAIAEMSKLFHKSEEEIRRIFGGDKTKVPAQNNFRNKDCQIQRIIGNFEAELIKEKLKSLEAKLDLLIQLAKEGK